MKGYRFYLEFDNAKDKCNGKDNGNVFAMDLELSESGRSMGSKSASGLAGVYRHPNSPTCWVDVSYEWLSENTKRISEAKAREIHPLLFYRLDNEK